MKVYRIKDGESFEREGVDAREMVATGEYSFVNPAAEKGATPLESSGAILARTVREQEAETLRAHAEQRSTAVRDAELNDENHPAHVARKAAKVARDQADEAHRKVALVPVNTNLKAEAEGAEKRAKELEATAEKVSKESAAADEALRKQGEAEKTAQLKHAGKAEAAASKPAAKKVKEEEVDLETLSKADLQEKLDEAGIAWNPGDTKAALIARFEE